MPGGQEKHMWAFVVAAILFFVGGVIHGIDTILGLGNIGMGFVLFGLGFMAVGLALKKTG
jgi:hypothetical protein